MRRTLIAALLAVGLTAVGLTIASPAQAATANPSTIYVPAFGGGCGHLASFWTGPGMTGTRLLPNVGAGLEGATGDTVTVVNECSIAIYVDTGSLGAGQRILQAAGTTATYAITNNGPLFEVASDQNLVTTIIAKTGVSGTSPSSGVGPDPVLQQFGKPATGTCDEAQPEGLNWAGVSSGGWGVTWSEWVNGRQGGYVCSRWLVYRSGVWVVA